jgi:hypothetical protein
MANQPPEVGGNNTSLLLLQQQLIVNNHHSFTENMFVNSCQNNVVMSPQPQPQQQLFLTEINNQINNSFTMEIGRAYMISFKNIIGQTFVDPTAFQDQLTVSK